MMKVITEDVPPNQSNALLGINKVLEEHGFPGGFIILFQENRAGKTGFASTIDAHETIRLLEGAVKELKEQFGETKGTKQ